MSGGRFVRQGIGRERSRKRTSGPSRPRELKYPEEGSGLNFQKLVAKPGTGNEAGQNNSNLAQHEIQVECCGMGTIRNDRSHLCFYTHPFLLPENKPVFGCFLIYLPVNYQSRL
jgi:hypothetical protein